MCDRFVVLFIFGLNKVLQSLSLGKNNIRTTGCVEHGRSWRHSKACNGKAMTDIDKIYKHRRYTDVASMPALQGMQPVHAATALLPPMRRSNFTAFSRVPSFILASPLWLSGYTGALLVPIRQELV